MQFTKQVHVLILLLLLGLFLPHPSAWGQSHPHDGEATQGGKVTPADALYASQHVLLAPIPVPGAVTLLNEIVFRPKGGQPQVVELKVGMDDGNLAGLKLINATGDEYVLPAGAVDFVPGTIVAILFDGQNRVKGTTIHAESTKFLKASGDNLRLEDVNGVELDFISWGRRVAQGVPLGRGGVIGHPPAGSAIGRLPTGTRPGPSEWVFFDPADASPGAPNQHPGVAVLRQANGFIFGPEPFVLSWYPAPQAVQYRVQIAREKTFSQVVFARTVDTPLVTTPALEVGEYVWRVQAIFADGTRARFSPVSAFKVEQVPPDREDQRHTPAPPMQRGIRMTLGATPAGGGTFPSLSQHKDTPMILLESANETGDHRYDADHGVLDSHDPADNVNCALASIAMINRYYGGNISQDYLGYYLFAISRSVVEPPGPEGDLNYKEGLHDNNITDVLRFALGKVTINPTPIPRGGGTAAQREHIWTELTAEIDAGRPVLLTEGSRGGHRGKHAIVMFGYEVRGSGARRQRSVLVMDPWNEGEATAVRGPLDFALNTFSVYFRIAGDVATAANDPPDLQPDKDGDGITDFDEKNRFGTNWQNLVVDKDTDRDCLSDKEEIRLSMYDADHGYALWVNGDGKSDGTGRDSEPYDNFDSDDELRPERDNDSDNGGLLDYVEDLTRTAHSSRRWASQSRSRSLMTVGKLPARSSSVATRSSSRKRRSNKRSCSSITCAQPPTDTSKAPLI